MRSRTANADDDLGDGTEALDESLEGSDDVSVIPESNAVTFNTTESGGCYRRVTRHRTRRLTRFQASYRLP